MVIYNDSENSPASLFHACMHAIARTPMHPGPAALKLMSSVHADRETELLATLRETYFPEAQHGEQESPERRYAG